VTCAATDMMQGGHGCTTLLRTNKYFIPKFKLIRYTNIPYHTFYRLSIFFFPKSPKLYPNLLKQKNT